MTRVTNFAEYQRSLANITSTQSRSAALQLQVSSGSKSSDYAGLGQDAGRLVTLESAHARAGQYILDNNAISTRLQNAESNVSQIFDVMSDFKQLLISALNAENAAELAMPQQAADRLDQVTGLLNAKVDNVFLFGGSVTNRAPVDLAGLPVAYALPSADGDSIGYYQGDFTVRAVQADDDVRVNYGVTAGDPAFEKAVRALDMVIKGGVSDRATLEHALEVTNQALNAIPDLRTKLGNSLKALDLANGKHGEFQKLAEGTIGDIKNVDVALAVTKLNDTQITLEASYLALSRLNQASLVNYL
ncbi:MAG: flagellin [Rhodospirillales bacterium]